MWLKCVATVFIAVVVSSFASDLINAESEPTLGDDDLAIPEWLNGKTETPQSLVPRRRTRRSALSIPPNTSVRITLDLSTAVKPLKNTGTFLTIDLPFRFVLPTYKDLVSIYGKFGDNEGSESTNAGFPVDYEFLEEQRANSQRRNIYKHIETAFQKYS